MLSNFFRQLLGPRKDTGKIPSGLAGTAEAMNRIAAAQQAEREGLLDSALQGYDDGIAQFPDSAELHVMRGNALRGLGRADEAIAAYRLASRLKPALAAAWYNLALTEHESGDAQTAEDDYRAAIAADPEFSRGYSSLLCLIGMGRAGKSGGSDIGWAPEQVLSEHRQWARLHADCFRSDWKHLPNPRDPERRLRIGYVSADFRHHAIACFLEPILASHNRDAFEVICYDNSAASDVTKVRLRELAAGWRPIDALDDDAVAATIRDDGIDLLIDLGGHTKGNRLLVFARKPAPVQISYLGYPNTTGLEAIDYRITDLAADPPGMTESQYVERLLRLPRSLWCYRPFDDMPHAGRSSRIAPGESVVFGSMNSCIKLNAEVIRLWARLLRALPDSRLLVATIPAGSAQRRLLEGFAAEGIVAGRIECAPRLDNAGFWELHRRIDVALDPFPMNGGTTTCETLWMGVPVVTLKGCTFAARAGCSLLTAAGFPQWIAASPDDYVQIAVALARDIKGRAALRSEMRHRLRQSALFDSVAFTRDLEGLYRTAWREWCAGGH